MKYLKYVFVINFLLVFNCKNPKVEIKNEIDQVLNKFNIQAQIEINKSDSNNLEIVFKFNKPYRIISNDYQSVFFLYLAQHITKKMNIHKSIRFISLFTDYPYEKQIFYYKEKEIDDFLAPSNINYLKTLEYCFLNLKKGDDIRLENNMKSITMKFSNTLENSNFFYTLFELCKSKTPSLDNNSDKKVILYHYYIKELIQEPNNMPQDVKEFRLKEIQFLEDFWKLAKGTNINNEEEFLKKTVALAN